MEIKQTIKLNVKVIDRNLVCKDSSTMQLIMGTKGIIGNTHIYGIKKINNEFHIPVKEIEKRKIILTERKNKIEDSLEIIEQVIQKTRNGEKNGKNKGEKKTKKTTQKTTKTKKKSSKKRTKN